MAAAAAVVDAIGKGIEVSLHESPCSPNLLDLSAKYVSAKKSVVAAGFGPEVVWQASRHLDRVDESTFLSEAAWVILSSGMRSSVIARVFPDITRAFFYWDSAREILTNRTHCQRNALAVFAHPRKIAAIVCAAQYVVDVDLAVVLQRLKSEGPCVLCDIPYIGPVTSVHLAKNLGIPLAKPDRHLVRIAEAAGYETPESLCSALSQFFGESSAVVDVVLWRFATLNSDYERFFASGGDHLTHRASVKSSSKFRMSG